MGIFFFFFFGGGGGGGGGGVGGSYHKTGRLIFWGSFLYISGFFLKVN